MQIAFTFDDGPNNVITPQVMDLFKEYAGRASFFLIGEHITEESIPVMHRMVEEGHEVANHSFSHPAFSSLTPEQVAEEYSKTTRLIEEITGNEVKYFRPPYIDCPDRLFDMIPYVFIEGKGCDDWDENKSVDYRVSKIMDFVEDGTIVLLHDSDYNDKTVETLKIVLPALKEKGYEFVTLTELFENRHMHPKPFEGVLYSQV